MSCFNFYQSQLVGLALELLCIDLSVTCITVCIELLCIDLSVTCITGCVHWAVIISENQRGMCLRNSAEEIRHILETSSDGRRSPTVDHLRVR